MGRIAEALKRAEQERRSHSPGRLSRTAGLADPMDVSAMLTLPTDVGQVDAGGLEVSDEVLPIVEGMTGSLVTYYDRSCPVSEQFRTLRTRLISLNPSNEHRVLAITSTVPKEGKSVSTVNLAFSLAEIRHLKTVVVDGDFRRSSLAKMLNLRNTPGLADLLRGEATYEEVLQPTPLPNLFFIAAGNTDRRSAAELLTSRKTADVFRRLHAQFHYSLVDTPPVTTVTDVGIIGHMCSAVILVVRLNKALEPMARRAVRLLQVNNIPILGALLVGDDRTMTRYGYQYSDDCNYRDYLRQRPTDDTAQ
ncbi:MAG: CpsD/CapB family tyrosine-protein kinase [Planctomycetes bacterium]|nr:CpsD/CapB family tyrosine-protein kinase [Planctomycetota bacterium]